MIENLLSVYSLRSNFEKILIAIVKGSFRIVNEFNWCLLAET